MRCVHVRLYFKTLEKREAVAKGPADADLLADYGARSPMTSGAPSSTSGQQGNFRPHITVIGVPRCHPGWEPHHTLEPEAGEKMSASV